jgi:WD40 repeat protein
LSYDFAAFIGHTNKINHLMIVPDTLDLISVSNDCTMRQWNMKNFMCTRLFKFADPITYVLYHQPKNLLFCSSWDKQVRAIDYEKGTVESAFVGAREAILTIHIAEDKIFLAGQDPVIRAYDLETGKDQIFEGHRGWVLCLATYKGVNEHGAVVNNWLLSGSDDNMIRIWDLRTGKVLQELVGHHNGVTSLCFANNELFSGSMDHYIICWDIDEIRDRIKET